MDDYGFKDIGADVTDEEDDYGFVDIGADAELLIKR